MSLNDQLNGILNDLAGLWLESSLMLGAILILLVGLFKPNAFIIKTLFVVIIGLAFVINYSNGASGVIMLDSIFLSENIKLFSSLFLVSTLLLLCFNRTAHLPEFFFLILALLVGSLFMTKGNNLLIIYLAIELASFASYILTNFSFKKKSFEAGLKYLLFGAISSATMLFGMGLIYGAVGSIYFSDWSLTVFEFIMPQVGLVMMLMGLFFKISIFPSHVWVPATYATAPADATAYMSVIPKLAGLVLLKRLFDLGIIESLGTVYNLVLLLGILTLIIGTLGAFTQSHARRMISFGAIAHSGFLLPFTLLNTSTANESFWFYAVVYSLMNFGVFYLLDVYERKGIESVDDYASNKGPVWLGTVFTLLLVSLVGLPPLAGFTAKFFLFTTLWESYQLTSNQLLLWYLIVTILVTVGSLFFYFKIPKALFLSGQSAGQSINFDFSTKILATLFCIVLLLLFFVPDLVMEAKHLLNNVHE